MSKKNFRSWYDLNLFVWVWATSFVILIYYFFNRKEKGNQDIVLRSTVLINSLWLLGWKQKEILKWDRVRFQRRFSIINRLAEIQKTLPNPIYQYDGFYLFGDNYFKITSKRDVFYKDVVDYKTLMADKHKTLGTLFSLFKCKPESTMKHDIVLQASGFYDNYSYKNYHRGSPADAVLGDNEGEIYERYVRYGFSSFYDFSNIEILHQDLKEGYGKYPKLLDILNEIELFSLPRRQDVSFTGDWYDNKGNVRFIEFTQHKILQKELYVTTRGGSENAYEFYGIRVYGYFIMFRYLRVYCDNDTRTIFFLGDSVRFSYSLSFDDDFVYLLHKKFLKELYNTAKLVAKEKGKYFNDWRISDDTLPNRLQFINLKDEELKG